MPSHKRLSLADIAREEQVQTPPAPAPVRHVPSQPQVQRSEAKAPPPAPVEKRRNPKSDFVKMSVTLPPEMNEKLQELSHARRMRKERYMLSDLVREALAQWLPQQPE